MKKNIRNILATALLIMGNAVAASAQDKYVGGDISLLPTNEAWGARYLDKDGRTIDDLLPFFKQEGGMNAMRVRLFVAPEKYDGTDKDANACQDLEYVTALGKRIKEAGLSFMLDFHYSDTWADPAKQWTPADWTQLTDDGLQAKIYEYTKECLTALKAAGAEPDMIQTGNEISFGMLWGAYQADESQLKKCFTDSPAANWTRFTDLLRQAGKACREVCPQAKIILHTERAAQVSVMTNFYDMMEKAGVDYDIIGLSYYPIWHNTIGTLETAISTLETKYADKQIMVVEVGAPYSWLPTDNEYTPAYDATEEGQRQFTRDLITMLNRHSAVTGLFWWWMEYNAYPWETTQKSNWWYAPLFNSNTGKAMPAFYEMKNFTAGAAGIREVSGLSRSGDWYTVSGMRLPERPLRRGHYINNNKKVAIR